MRIAREATARSRLLVRPRVACDDPKVWPVLLGGTIAACHLPCRVLEAVGVEQRLMELAPLVIAHPRQWRVSDDLLAAAAELKPLAIRAIVRVSPVHLGALVPPY